MRSVQQLEEALGHVFRDPQLLTLALTHPSVCHESPPDATATTPGSAETTGPAEPTGPLPHNQRLEFLGDAVLGLVLTRELYLKFPKLGEGRLTKARAQMVNRRTLAHLSRRFELGQHLILSRGEEASGGRQRESALADAFEAVVGAIFLDGGYDAGAEFVLRACRDLFGELTEVPNLSNPKGELQELLQASSALAPDYSMTRCSGPDHDRLFECSVSHAGVELGRGAGRSKKEAESQAARAALEKLRVEKPGG